VDWGRSVIATVASGVVQADGPGPPAARSAVAGLWVPPLPGGQRGDAHRTAAVADQLVSTSVPGPPAARLIAAVRGPMIEARLTHLRVIEFEVGWAAGNSTVQPSRDGGAPAASSIPRPVPMSPQRRAEPREAMPALACAELPQGDPGGIADHSTGGGAAAWTE
jgi:hypothetical protein